MNTKSPAMTLVVGLLLLLIMGASIFFITQKGGGLFELRKRASTSSGTAEITLTPTTGQYYVGDRFTVDVMLSTGGRAISGAGIRLFYPFAGDTPELDVKDMDANATGVQIQSFASNLDSSLTTDVNLVTKQPERDGTVFIDYRAITQTPTGYTNSASQKLATITFKAHKVTTKTIEHDPQRSQITDKETGLDVLKTITPLAITISADTEPPTATITQGPAEGSTGNRASVTFAWSATDAPARAANVTVPLDYAYKFDDTDWSAWGSTTTITSVLTHGQHTFKVKARDPADNVSPVVSRSFTLDLTPHIDTVAPDSGTRGTRVTITGYNFGASTKRVQFGGVNATNIESWTDTQIVARVPDGAGNDVVVIVDGRRSNAVPFNVNTKLKVVFTLQGITQDRGAKTVAVVVKKGATEVVRFDAQEATWSTNENAYKINVGQPDSIETGNNYSVSLKETSRLRKKFTGLQMRPGVTNQVVKTQTADRLQVADFDNNNILELQDFGLLMSNFTAQTGLVVPVTDANAKYDLNGDANLSIDDIGLLLSNLTGLSKRGDDE